MSLSYPLSASFMFPLPPSNPPQIFGASLPSLDHLLSVSKSTKSRKNAGTKKMQQHAACHESVQVHLGAISQEEAAAVQAELSCIRCRPGKYRDCVVQCASAVLQLYFDMNNVGMAPALSTVVVPSQFLKSTVSEKLSYIHAIPLQPKQKKRLNSKEMAEVIVLASKQCAAVLPRCLSPKSLLSESVPGLKVADLKTIISPLVPSNPVSRSDSSSPSSSCSSSSASFSSSHSSSSSSPLWSSFSLLTPDSHVTSFLDESSVPLQPPHAVLSAAQSVPIYPAAELCLYSFRSHESRLLHSIEPSSAGSPPVLGELPRKYGKRTRDPAPQSPNNRQKTSSADVQQQHQDIIGQQQIDERKRIAQVQQQQHPMHAASFIEFDLDGIDNFYNVVPDSASRTSLSCSGSAEKSLFFTADENQYSQPYWSPSSPLHNFGDGDSDICAAETSIFTEALESKEAEKEDEDDILSWFA